MHGDSEYIIVIIIIIINIVDVFSPTLFAFISYISHVDGVVRVTHAGCYFASAKTPRPTGLHALAACKSVRVIVCVRYIMRIRRVQYAMYVYALYTYIHIYSKRICTDVHNGEQGRIGVTQFGTGKTSSSNPFFVVYEHCGKRIM